jgi:hypothetical protein
VTAKRTLSWKNSVAEVGTSTSSPIGIASHEIFTITSSNGSSTWGSPCKEPSRGVRSAEVQQRLSECVDDLQQVIQETLAAGHPQIGPRPRPAVGAAWWCLIEVLSTVLLECTLAGLGSCTVTHMTELRSTRELVAAVIGQDAASQMLIRVGIAPTRNDAPATPVALSTTC